MRALIAILALIAMGLALSQPADAWIRLRGGSSSVGPQPTTGCMLLTGTTTNTMLLTGTTTNCIRL